MKQIFIGSANEAIIQAELIAEVLSEVKGIKTLLWKDAFPVGEITL